ncbi:hypothetical protein E2P81_ATG02439 [Venturia nashicola]|nr:hypothetical protein E2P81_ATG02439 [Venturia nashicola]
MKHLSNRKSLSCFMSLTSDKTHTRGLAIKRARHIQDPFQYSDNSDDLVRYEIDTKCVHAHIYKVVDLLCVFHIPVPSHRDISTEYLILKEIPGEAIVDTSTIKAMRMESVPDDEDDDEPLEGEELKPIIPRDTRQRRSWRSRFAYRNGKIIEEAEDMKSKDPMITETAKSSPIQPS